MPTPFNHKRGQRIRSNANGIACDMAYLAHYNIPAASAVVASNVAVLAAVNLGTEVQGITEGITNPAIPRAFRIKGNLSGVAGDVVITGTNYADEEITETIVLNGATAANGAKAFKAVMQIDLPAQTHTATAQVETATVVGTITTAGDASVTVTCTGMTGTPKTISVAVAGGDNAAAIAGKIRTALAADSAVTALFTVGGTGPEVILTRTTPAANITNLNIALANGTCVGITAAATSADTTAGVAYDTVSVGFNEVLGLPYKLSHNTVISTFKDNTLEGTAPTVTVSAMALEGNTIDLNSALNTKAVDVYLIV